MAPVLAPGVSASVLKGPLSALNALSCGSASQVHQLVHDVAAQLEIPLEPAAAYQWEFGDGDISIEVSPTHAYRTPDSYGVILRVADAVGRLDADFITITVTANPDPRTETPAAGLARGAVRGLGPLHAASPRAAAPPLLARDATPGETPANSYPLGDTTLPHSRAPLAC
jgi:hypothetical protein